MIIIPEKQFLLCYYFIAGRQPMGTDQFLYQKSTLIFGWEIADFVMINQKSTSQPKINCQPNFNRFSTLVFQLQTWLNCGWEVDFWLIIVTKSTISQPTINVEYGWGSTLIQRWEVDLGTVFVVIWKLVHFRLMVNCFGPVRGRGYKIDCFTSCPGWGKR